MFLQHSRIYFSSFNTIMLFFNICTSSAKPIYWVIFCLPLGYDSECTTSFGIQGVWRLINHHAEHTLLWVASSYATVSAAIKCPEHNQQFLISLISTRAFTRTIVLKNTQFLESLFWFYFNLATYQSTRMKLCSRCQDNHCLFSRREKKIKDL